MMKKFLIGLVLGLFLICLVSASFNLGTQNYSVQKEYPKGSYLISWINISFNNHPLNSKFTDSVSNSIPLIEVFDMYGNQNYTYSCSTGNCDEEYQIFNPELSKTATLKKLEYELYAFNITDQNIDSINSLSFKINSNADSSCVSQFKIDIGNDGSYEIANNLADTTVCSGTYRPTCYTIFKYDEEETIIDTGDPLEILNFLVLFKKIGSGITGKPIYESNVENITDVNITTTPLCSEITFPEAPGYKIGAWVKHINTPASTLKMEIYSLNGEKKSECNLNSNEITSNGSDVYCQAPEFSLVEGEKYYVCISQTSSQTAGKYVTRGRHLVNGCSFSGIPPQTKNAFYDLSVQKLKYKKLDGTTLNINNTFGQDENLGDLIEKYINETYGGLSECSSGCIVPLKLTSYVNNGAYDNSGIGGGNTTTKTTSTSSANANVIAPITGLASLTTCWEDDGGINAYIEGVTWNSTNQYFDQCTTVSGQSYLKEYYCSPEVYFQHLPCYFGCTTVNGKGKCNPSCNDPDKNSTNMGINPYIQTTVIVDNASGSFTGTDVCYSGDSVKEYLCSSSNNLAYVSVPCQTGYTCLNGACTATGSGGTPIIQYAYANNIQPTSANLYANTNMHSECRYSRTTPIYSSMTSFDFTGQTSHSTSLTGLTAGTQYTYHIKCKNISESIVYDVTFTTSTGAYTCSDSDGGQIKTTKGTTNGLYNGISYSSTDSCNSNMQVKEYYCNGNYNSSANMDCDAGQICSDGACIESTSGNCYDNDTTQNINILGKVNGKYPNGTNYEILDKCISGKLVQYKCENNMPVALSPYTCPGSCSNGVCTGTSLNCIDSDANLGIQSVYTKGNVTYDTKLYPDVCSSNILKEQTCYNDALRVVNLTCPFGCNNGACIKKVTNTTIPNHQITLKTVDLKYAKNNIEITTNKIYNLKYADDNISSSFQKLILDGKFKLPETPGFFTYVLKLSNSQVYSEQLKISNISMTVSPSNVQRGILTTFTAEILPNEEVEYLLWDFGDGSGIINDSIEENIGTATMQKSYSELGSYALTLTARINSKDYTGSYPINVVTEILGGDEMTCQEIVDLLNSNLDNLEQEISQFDESFDKDSLTNALKINELGDLIDEFDIECDELEQAGGTTDDIMDLYINYWFENEDVFNNLMISTINQDISEQELFNIERENIDLEKLSDITGESYDESLDYLYEDEIISWNQKELISDVITRTYEFEELTGDARTGLKVFEFSFEKTSSVENYFIIDPIEDLAFDKISFFEDNLDYTYSEILSNQNSLTLSTTEDMESFELPTFISPSIDELDVLGNGDDIIDDDDTIFPNIKENKTLFIILLCAGIILLAGIIFLIIFLKRRKEKEMRLFKNKTNLYNIMHYINNSKRKGMTNEQILENLKKAGWTPEQIKYAIKKFSKQSN